MRIQIQRWFWRVLFFSFFASKNFNFIACFLLCSFPALKAYLSILLFFNEYRADANFRFPYPRCSNHLLLCGKKCESLLTVSEKLVWGFTVYISSIRIAVFIS